GNVPSVLLPCFRLTLLPVERHAALMAHARTARPAAGQFIQVLLNADRAAFAAKDHDVRDRDRRFLLSDAAGDLLCRVRPRMPLHQVDAFDDEASGVLVDLEHASCLAHVSAGDHFHLIVELELNADRRIFLLCNSWHDLNNLRGERYDLHVALVTQLAGNRSEDAGADRLADFIDQHGGIRIEPDVAAVAAPRFLPHPHNDAADHFTLLDGGIR